MKRALLTLLLLVVASGAAVAVIDPFYRNRMESGLRAFEQSNWERAAHELRIACFGHLDEPVALAEGLIRLAIVDAQRADEDSFRRIFSRLVELEEKFSAYSEARVPTTVRQRFERLAASLVPAQSLQAAEGFQAIVERAEVARLAALPPERRRAELQTKLEAEPDRTDWLLEMARLELAERRPRPALDWLERLPPAAAAVPPATCLRQQAASEAGDCGATDLARPFCQAVPPPVVEFRLECLVEAGRWPEAAVLIGGLDVELRSRRRIVRLERRIQKNVDATENAGAPDDTAPMGTPPPSMPPTPAAELAEPSSATASEVVSQPAALDPADLPSATALEPATTTAAADSQEVERLRRRLATAATRDELTTLMAEAAALADSDPSTRNAQLLAAEVAYLLSDWPVAIRYFRLAGELRPEEAGFAFYQAVALYESGDPMAAAEVLRPVASRLERTSFVDAWIERILAPGI
jgi:hypothetical protein